MSFPPNTWKIERLGDVAKTTSGGTPSRKNKSLFGGEIQWFKSGELTDSFIEDGSEETITKEGFESSNCKLFPAGTLLMAMYGATVGKLGVLKFQATTNQAVCAIFPSHKINRDYLFWFLKYKRNDLIHNSFGAAQPNISQTIIREIEIPIPPIDEQRRIVARIEELTRRAEEALQLRKEAAAQIATQFFHVRRNTYQSLLSDFPTKPLGKCGKAMGGGTPSKKRDDYWQGDIPWVAPKEMKTFRIRASSEQIAEAAISESSAKLIPAGSVLFVVRGMILARHVPVAVSDVPCAINQDMKAIVPAKGILADYLAHMLWGANDILQGMVETAGHGTKKLETPAWSNLEIPIPDTEKQKAVIDELTIFQEKLAELELLQKETAQEIEHFQSALLAKAFRGEL